MASGAATEQLPAAQPPPAAPAASRAREARSLGRNVSALAGGQAITWLMTLAWTLVVPRALGPGGMGLLVSALAVTGVFGVVLGLGTRTYLVRELVVRWHEAPQLVGTALVLRALLAPLFALAIAVYARAAFERDGRLVLYLVAGAAILTLLAEPLQAAFQAMERMEYLAYSDVLNKSAQGLLGIAVVLAGLRVTGVAACALGVAALVLVLNGIWLRGRLPVAVHTSRRRLAGMVRESVAFWAFGVFFMVYLWIDAVMLSLLTRPEVVGWYGVPTKLFQTMMFLPVVVSTAWLPRLVAAFEEGPERLRAAARAPLELVLVLSLPLCAGVAIAAGPAIRLLYGGAYAQAAPVLVVLGLCLPPMYLNIMLNQVLVAARRQAVWTWVMAGATVLNPALNAGLIPLTEHRYANGAIGAAVSLLLTELAIVAVGVALVGREVFAGGGLRRLALAALAAVAMWATAFALRPLGAVPALCCGALVFGLLALVLGVVTPEQRRWLGEAVNRLRRR